MTNQPEIQAGVQVETPSEVMARLRKGKTWLWRRLKRDPSFPRPFYISPREPMFLRHEVDAWIAAQIATRGAQ